jgi:hypothetical protein
MGTIAHVDVGAERERARRAHRERRWTDAVDAFLAVDGAGPLDVEDQEHLAEALDLVGRGDDAVAALQRAYTARVAADDIGAALRDAFWLWRAMAFNAEFTRAGAWMARAARLVEAHADCAQQGYLLLPEAERELRDGEYRAAFATAGHAAAWGTRCGDPDLVTVARHLQGRALVGEGRVAAARRTFQQLGARPDLARLDVVRGGRPDFPDPGFEPARGRGARVDRRGQEQPVHRQ